MISQDSNGCGRSQPRLSNKFSANDNGGSRGLKENAILMERLLTVVRTTPQSPGVNTRAGIPTASWRTLRFSSAIQNWPPWWPLPLLLMALAFASGWMARGILSRL